VLNKVQRSVLSTTGDGRTRLKLATSVVCRKSRKKRDMGQESRFFSYPTCILDAPVIAVKEGALEFRNNQTGGTNSGNVAYVKQISA